MKVSREAAARTRERILDAAGQLFRENGFDGVGVADIMKQAGLTHGGFYGHFASKDDLVAAVCNEMSARRADVWGTADGPARLRSFLEGYLSATHRDQPGDGCGLAALGADVAREPLPARAAFTEALRARLARLTTMIPGRSAAARRRKALATLAGIVGALTLSRAVTDPALSDELLAAARETFAGPGEDEALSPAAKRNDRR